MTKDMYRRCASIAVFRQCDDAYEMLLVHKPRKNDAWQLPQGGCEEGESVTEAALREIQEEAGIKPTIIDTSDHVYQYDFPKSYRRFRPDNICGQRVEYVFATAPQDMEVTVDDEEIDAFVWVTHTELPKYIKRKAYRDLVLQLYHDGISLLS
ncbi:NUDIX hydrolase [Candidatus Peribacteria bacterium]|nr:NUDIX hydrolase [Candidatus Peribacteria bacterium]